MMKKRTLIILVVFSVIGYFAFQFLSKGLQNKVSIVDLNERELQIQADLRKEFKCRVGLSHDDWAVPKNKKDGNFNVNFDFSSIKDTETNLCKRDSAYLIPLSKSIAKRVYSVIDHKKNYAKITVHYVTWKQELDKMSGADCEKTFAVMVTDL